MSIADKLTYLNVTKSLLREAINAAGGNLTQETPFREYAGGWLRDQSASLILDFSKQQYAAKDKVSMFPDRVGFEDIVTFTRSTGGGRFNAQGEYEWLPANQPRIDYDPVTGECRGLLNEEQRTNLLTHSSDLSQWTVSRLAQSFDDGGVRLTETTESGAHICIRYMSFSAGAAYTFSVEVKSSDRYVRLLFPSSAFTSQIGAYFRLTDGTVAAGVSTGVTATITPSGNGRYVCSISAVATATASGNADFRLALHDYNATYMGDGVSSAVFYRAQLEAGSFPTSYIPTTTAQVTRAADIVSVNELSPWYNPNQGCFSIKAKGHIGDPLLTAGDAFVIADSDELKEYQVSYSEDPQATQVDMGKGLIESIRYWPRETT